MPSCSHACSTDVPGSTSISIPSIVSLGMGGVPLLGGDTVRGVAIFADPALHLRAEVADQTLDRPGGGISEGADRVAFDLPRDVEEHVDLLRAGVALHHPLHDPEKPACALAAGRALPAALMHVEMRQAGDRVAGIPTCYHTKEP